ncbi:DUF6268 family outer membrane beta-barrel protein [Fulvivirga maritima]|uniref:DUF6268 family outer membrane beta-barrel protein n=1 Tax=Fulvivirga maritima TaxID=2904247 RepID=UPI001F353A0C|nr:DUF6268 family outer membrane beta-barrel protein [Fulvivirga maritima]UII28336.1 DUF6268 family outer membrane beta-barrel protein [Fulvivirga maritima]
MNFIKTALFVALFASAGTSWAQVNIKTEYFSKSHYRYSDDDDGHRVGDSEGSAMVYQLAAKIPLSIKVEEDKKNIWGLTFNTAYAALNNHHFNQPLVIDEITNMGVGVFNLRDLNDKWTLISMLGVGVYATSPNLDDLRGNQILLNTAALFIRHINPNLDLGVGAAINNSFGYPMLFPALYLKWTKEGKYTIDVSMLEGVDISVAYEASPKLKLSYVVAVDGQLAMVNEFDDEQMFTHQYIVTGFKPELKLGNHLSMPLVLGISAMRTAQLNERKLKSLWVDATYYFGLSAYGSLGLTYNFE